MTLRRLHNLKETLGDPSFLAKVLVLARVQVLAQVLVDIARIQDDEVGDGTTSVAVLAGPGLGGIGNGLDSPQPIHHRRA